MSAGWAAQPERGGVRLLRIALWLITTLGQPVGRLLLLPITAWFLLTSGPARAASRDYLSRALGRPATRRDVARHFHTFAAAILDRVFLLTGRTQGYHIQTDGLDHVAAILNGGRGCILLGAHLGSFEVLRAVAQRSPVPVWALMYRRNAGALTRILDRLAPDIRESIIEVGDSQSMLRAHECVMRGEIVGILADRAPDAGALGHAAHHPAGHRMVQAAFLGGVAAFPAGPFILASTLGAPVVLFHAVRTGPRRYAVRFQPFADRVVLRRADRTGDLREVVHRYAGLLEAGCRAHPYNWFNFFPFWEAAHDPAAHDPAAPHFAVLPDAGRGTRTGKGGGA